MRSTMVDASTYFILNAFAYHRLLSHTIVPSHFSSHTIALSRFIAHKHIHPHTLTQTRTSHTHIHSGVALLGAGATGLYQLLCYEPTSKAQDVKMTLTSKFEAVMSGTEYVEISLRFCLYFLCVEFVWLPILCSCVR